MESLALLLYFEEHYHSYAVAGALVAGFALGSVVLTAAVGPLVGRIGAARVLAGFAVLQSGAFCLLLAAVELGAARWAVAVVVAAAGAFGPPVSATARAAWRTAAPGREVRELGYTLDAVSQELIWLLGPLLVTACLPLGGPGLAVAALPPLVLVGGLYYATGPLVRTVGGVPAGSGRTRLSSRVRWLLIGATLSGFGFGAVEVAVPGLAEHLGSRNAAGLLLAAMSVGSLVGGLLYATRSWRAPVAARHAWSALVVALLTATLVAATSVPVAVLLAALAGAAWSPLLASQYALFAETTSDQETDRDTVAVFTWSLTWAVIGAAAGSAATGLTLETAGPDQAFLLTGAAFAAGGLSTLLAPRAGAQR
jgi:hypothetical protein